MTLAGSAGDQVAGGAGEEGEDGGGGGRGGRPGGKVGQRYVIHLQTPISTNVMTWARMPRSSEKRVQQKFRNFIIYK